MGNTIRTKSSRGSFSDNHTKVTMPVHGHGLESLVTSNYSLNNEEHLGKAYEDCKATLKCITDICDKHSIGDEADAIVDNQIRHEEALFKSEIAENNHQISRIQAEIETRKSFLDSKISEFKELIAETEGEIEPLKGLRAQFQIHIGKKTVSVGIIITILAIVLDAIMNYGFLQTIYLDNRFSLMVAATCLCLMSDGSMFGFGLLLSRRKEKFMPKPIFYLSAVLLVAAFILSILGSIMIRFGSMPETFGTITASGDYLSKSTYSMAEYGATLVTAFATTITGLLSGIFSYDENAYLVSIREKAEKKLDQYRVAIKCLEEERSILEKCDDPHIRDQEKRAAAEEHLIALRAGLKLYCRKMMSLSIEDPTFLEKMARSGNELVSEKNPDKEVTPIYLNNAC